MITDSTMIDAILFLLCNKKKDAKRRLLLLAEGERFELPDPRRSPVFKTGALDHSAILPNNSL